MKRILWGLPALAILPLIWGCSSSSALKTLVSPAVVQAAGPQITVFGQILHYVYNSESVSFYCSASQDYYTSETTMFSAQVQLSSPQEPVTTAAITITGAGCSIPITYGGWDMYGDAVSYISTFVSAPLTMAYQPGADYSLTITTPWRTLSASVTAPGDITIAPDGSSCSWQYNSNNNSVGVFPYPGGGDNYSFRCLNNAISPFTIPSTAYSNPATYCVDVVTDNVSTAIANGVGEFHIRDEFEIDVNK